MIRSFIHSPGTAPTPIELATPSAPVRRVLRIAMLASIAAALSGLLLLGISGWFLTGTALAGAAGIGAVQAFNYLIPSASIRGLAIARTVARYGERVLSHQGALTAMADLRSRLFRVLARQGSRTAPNLSAGDASARLIGDITALEDLIVRQPTRPGSLFAALAGIALAALAGWLAALLLALLFLAYAPVLNRLSRRLTARPAREAADALGDLRSRYVEMAQARAEIATYGLVEPVLAELGTIVARLDQARIRLFRAEAVVAGVQLGFGALAAIAVLASANGPAPLVAMAMLAATAAVEGLAAISRTALRQASVDEGLRRLEQLLALEAPEAPSSGGALHQPVSIDLAGTPLAPSERAALQGQSGSGKTLVLEALAGLRASSSPIRIDGTPLGACPEDVLTTQFALSAQDAPLLIGTVADNLRIARPGLDEAAMHDALRVACLDERIARLPQGLDTPLGEDGAPLSGGERKRLSLARALLAGRPWLLLDEPTEGLDAITERRLVERLGAWLDASGTGLVLVSHRPLPLELVRHRIGIAELIDLQSL